MELTPEIQERLLILIESGNEYHVAARAVGLRPEEFDRWMLEQKEPYMSFRTAIDKARASAEAHLVSRVQQAAANGSWQAAAWLLDRGFTGWQRATAEQRNANNKGEHDDVDPFSELDNVRPIRRSDRQA